MDEQDLRLHRCCFTGHRPEKLKRSEEEIKKGLEEAIAKAVIDGYTTFITGMARGVDIWAGQIVLRLRQNNPGLKLIVALPYPDCDSRWSANWRKQFADVLEAADLVKVISPIYSMASLSGSMRAGRLSAYIVTRVSPALASASVRAFRRCSLTRWRGKLT